MSSKQSVQPVIHTYLEGDTTLYLYSVALTGIALGGELSVTALVIAAAGYRDAERQIQELLVEYYPLAHYTTANAAKPCLVTMTELAKTDHLRPTSWRRRRQASALARSS